MQVLQAGQHKLIFLELEIDVVTNIAKQAGFDSKLKDSPRSMLLELTAQGREAPLLLFDAADPANLGWFSRCTFYVDGRNGNVMQTPITMSNKWDRSGKPQPNSVRLTISKELPATFRLPGKQAITAFAYGLEAGFDAAPSGICSARRWTLANCRASRQSFTSDLP